MQYSQSPFYFIDRLCYHHQTHRFCLYLNAQQFFLLSLTMFTFYTSPIVDVIFKQVLFIYCCINNIPYIFVQFQFIFLLFFALFPDTVC
jgi:hypothetical protein